MNPLEKIESYLKAKDRDLAALVERTRLAQAERDDLETAIRVLRDLFPDLESDLDSDASESNLWDPVPVSVNGTPNGNVIPHSHRRSQGDIAAEILRDYGRPMRASEIAHVMINQGAADADRRKLRNSIFTTMTRKADVFQKVGTGMWTLVDMPPAETESAVE